MSEVIIQGSAPVQSFGFHNGHVYYFRARHHDWYIAFKKYNGSAYHDTHTARVFSMDGGHESASWIDHDKAKSVVDAALVMFDAALLAGMTWSDPDEDERMELDAANNELKVRKMTNTDKEVIAFFTDLARQ